MNRVSDAMRRNATQYNTPLCKTPLIAVPLRAGLAHIIHLRVRGCDAIDGLHRRDSCIRTPYITFTALFD